MHMRNFISLGVFTLGLDDEHAAYLSVKTLAVI